MMDDYIRPITNTYKKILNIYIYILDVKMELKLHLYSITWVTSVLKPNEPGSATWNLDFRTWSMERGC